MNQPFVHLMNIILVSRAVYIFKDTPVSRKNFIVMLTIQLAGLFSYRMNLAWWILFLLLSAQAIVAQLVEMKSKKTEGARIGSLVFTVILLSVFFSPWIQLEFNPAPFAILASLQHYTLLFLPIDAARWKELSIFLLGGLLVLNEANLLLRSLLRKLGLVPQGSGESGLNQKEYNAGRIIGILERMIIYVAVLNNEVAAIGLVLGAKAFTRFKELDDRSFAEYVLIGTLVSAFLAVSAALMVKALLVLPAA